MKKSIAPVLFIILMALLAKLNAQEIQNPKDNPVIDFINNEKIRIKAEEAANRFLYPERYIKKDNLSTELPSFQVAESETAVSKLAVPESEIHAAINPKNPLNMVISPIKQTTNDPTSTVTCPVYYTFDGGVTWSSSNFITKPFSQQVSLMGGGDPVFVFDADGNLYFSWINLYLTFANQNPDSIRAALFWAKSTDGGKTFQFDEKNCFGGKIFSVRYSNNPSLNQMLDKQWMAADLSNSQWRNSVYTSALYLSVTGFSQQLQLQIYRKRANESAFSVTPTIINTTGMVVVQFGSIDVDNNGFVHYTFYGSNGSSQALYHCVSKDGGVTFSNPVKISNIFGSMRGTTGVENVPGLSSQRLYPSPYMAVDKSNTSTKGNICITWSANGINNKLTKGMDVYFSKSTDGGSTWSSPLVVNNDGLQLVHSFYSNIAINDSGFIAITFYDRRNHTTTTQSQGITDHYIAISYDGGNTFVNSPVSAVPSRFDRIGVANNGFGIGEYNAVLMTGDYAYPVWADGRTNNGNINVYFAKVKLDKNGTGVEEVKSISNELFINSISPNPANDIININYFAKYQGKALIDIIDMNGNEVVERIVENSMVNDNNLSINLRTLNSGTYFVRIAMNGIITLNKFVVNK